MANRLSYSQLQKWTYCQKAWEFHYKLRVRSTKIPSSLIFGSAIGKTFEYELNLKKGDIRVEITPEMKEFFGEMPFGHLPSCIEIFDYYWHYANINDELVSLKENPDIIYLKTDHDEELGETPWSAMRAKGHLIIRSFIQNFLPLVEHVYSTEEKVELTSGEDSNVGYADTVVKLKDIHKPVIMDFKTAGKAYTKESVRESVQLAQYIYTLGDKYDTKLAGYAVFLKNIVKNRTKVCKVCEFNGTGTKYKTCPAEYREEGKKDRRCGGEWEETINPECKMQLIIDDIPVEFQESVIDQIGLINDQINTGVIEKNLEACNNDFGKKCQYFDLCHSGSMEGLIILNEK